MGLLLKIDLLDVLGLSVLLLHSQLIDFGSEQAVLGLEGACLYFEAFELFYEVDFEGVENAGLGAVPTLGGEARPCGS